MGQRQWLSIGSIAVGSKGLVTFVPKDSGARADAIVVLGCGDQFRQTRVEVAAEL